MALRDDGQVQGSVSGGCIETDLVERLLNGEFTSNTPVIFKYGTTQDEARRYGLPCGGTRELLLEREPDVAALEQLADRIGRGELARRTVRVGHAGTVSLRVHRAMR